MIDANSLVGHNYMAIASTSLDYKTMLLSGSLTQLLLNIHSSKALVGEYQALIFFVMHHANPDGQQPTLTFFIHALIQLHSHPIRSLLITMPTYQTLTVHALPAPNIYLALPEQLH